MYNIYIFVTQKLLNSSSMKECPFPQPSANNAQPTYIDELSLGI